MASEAWLGWTVTASRVWRGGGENGEGGRCVYVCVNRRLRTHSLGLLHVQPCGRVCTRESVPKRPFFDNSALLLFVLFTLFGLLLECMLHKHSQFHASAVACCHDNGTEPVKGPVQAKAKAGRPTAASDEQFSVVQYIIHEAELPWQSLAIDSDMKHGQIRQLNVLHRDALVEQFTVNPPHMIELITVLDQGVHRYMSAPFCRLADNYPS